MKRISIFELADGTTKKDEVEALQWERTLVLRGIIQRSGVARDGSMTPTTAATEIIKNFDEIQKTWLSYKRKINAAQKRKDEKKS